MIGLIGCGAMGSGMVERLRSFGHSILCYDVSTQSLERVKKLGAHVTQDLSSVAKNCSLIIFSLPKASVVDSVYQEIKTHLQANTIILDTSTSEPNTTQAIHADIEKFSCFFIDAPVSGGPKGARSGTMTMLLGGDKKIIQSIEPILNDMTGKLVYVGPSGSAHTAKIANNLLCAANLVLVSEMSKLAEKVGVDLETLLAGVNAGSGRSGVSEVNFPTWIVNNAYDSGFTMGLMRKDVGLATNMAEEMNLDLPATSAIAKVWEDSRQAISDSADFNEIYNYGNNQ